MDRVKDYLSKLNLQQKIVLIAVILLVVSALSLKSIQQNWWQTCSLPDHSDLPALVFFNKDRGCECEMLVYHSAQEQLNAWQSEERGFLPLYNYNLEQCRNLARQLNIRRAPALLLIDQNEKLIYTQSEIITDEVPFDLSNYQDEIHKLLKP